MNCKYILPALTVLLSLTANAQQKPALNIWNPPVQKGINTLKIGEVLPDFKFSVFNDVKNVAKVSDYSDKLVIYDFGNTHCGGCVAALPHMDKLQKEFGDKIKIFWVTPESRAVLQKFWSTNKIVKNNGTPTIIEDSTLRAYFKHKSWPHEAWVYKGKLIALTGPDYVDANNIRKVLNGQTIYLPIKDDFYVFDGTKQPLFIADPNQIDTASTAMRYVAISDYKEGVNSFGLSGGSGTVRNPKKKTVRTFFLNQPIFLSYIQNWMRVVNTQDMVKPNPFIVDPNQVIWEVADKSKYTYNKQYGYDQDWIRLHGICYESSRVDTGQTDKDIAKLVIADLNRLLGLNARWEKRKEKVLVLVRTTQTDKLKSKAKIITTMEDHDNGINRNETIKGNLHQLRDYNLENLTYAMNMQEANPYIFNESGYKDNVDMDLTLSSWTDITGIRQSLQAYGLDLKEEERMVDKFVFSEVNGGMVIDGKMAADARARRDAQKDMKNPTDAENKAYLVANKKKLNVVTLPSGLQYKIVKKGTGTKPLLNDKIAVHFTGMLVNGKIFDSSYQNGKPMLTKAADLIKGWQEALLLMPAGSKWVIYVPAELAYGTHTGQGSFPPNSNMIFEMELLNVIK